MPISCLRHAVHPYSGTSCGCQQEQSCSPLGSRESYHSMKMLRWKPRVQDAAVSGGKHIIICMFNDVNSISEKIL